MPYNLNMEDKNQQDNKSRHLKSERIELRLSPAERETFQDAADLAGIPLSAWIRERLRQSATKELEASALPIAFLENMRTR